MMVLTFWLSRTLEMMQNDMRTSGIDVLLGQKWFWCKMSLFLEVCEQHGWLEFICVCTANECLAVCGCGRDEVERFGLFQHYLHVFVNMNNQHVSKQTACFISGSCRMFS